MSVFGGSFDHRRGLGLVLLAALALVVIDVWWLVADRQGYPVHIDEAGYMTIALNDHAALVDGGLGSYWHAFELPYPYAPLVPALTAFVYLARTSILASYTTELAFFVVLALACYGVGARLLGPRLGALAAIVTLTVPGVTNFTREYLFAVPSTALFTCAVYALLRSDGLRSRVWAAGLGASLGLMLLARTMSIAILPAVLLAALVRVVTLERDRLRAVTNLALAAVLAAVIAGVWYVPNLSPVFHYLTEYGYGSRSEVGTGHSILSWTWWTREMHTLFAEDLFVPLGLVVGAGLATAAVGTARKVWVAGERAAALVAATRADAATLAIALGGGYLALSSSPNRGAGFALMLVPLLVMLAAVSLRRAGRAVPALTALLGVISVVNLVASTDVWHGLSEPRGVDVPFLGPAPVIDGEGNALGALRQQLPGDPTHFASRERAWMPAAKRAASRLIDYAHSHGHEPVVVFGMRNRVFNTNTVALAARLYYGLAIPMAQLDPSQGGDTAAAYARYLANPSYGQPNFLLTSNRVAGDYSPNVSQAQAVLAARLDGFHPAGSIRLPDGRLVTFWWLSRGPGYAAPRGL